MTKRKVEIMILCEDTQQQVFARRFLKKYGFNERKIRLLPIPSGKESGEQYVRNKYWEEVKLYRSRNYQTSIALVVLIDADKNSVEQILEKLDDSLVANSLNKRQPNEKIGIFIPKRNIETWIYYLQDNLVNEEDSYPKLRKESDCEPCLENLYNQCQNNSLLDNAPSSLKRACDEFRRIL